MGIFTTGRNVPEIKTVQIDKAGHEFSFPLPDIPVSVKLAPDVWLLMDAEFSAR